MSIVSPEKPHAGIKTEIICWQTMPTEDSTRSSVVRTPVITGCKTPAWTSKQTQKIYPRTYSTIMDY